MIGVVSARKLFILKRIYLTTGFVLFTFFISSAQVYEEYLLSGWTFKSENSRVWLPAEVPGSVQNDLQLNGRKAEATLESEWEYQTNFIADEHILARDHVELYFQGIDTDAVIYLNDQEILHVDNMFRSWRIPVKSVLKKGVNKLHVHFKSHPSSSDSLLRKAVYHFDNGTDSSGVPIGIWKPVILQSWDTYRMVNAFIRQDQLADREALMTAVIDVKGIVGTALQIEIFDGITERTYEKRKLIIQEEIGQFEIPFIIKNPKYWWPSSLGKPNLYSIGIRVTNESNAQLLTKRIGLRTIEIFPSNKEGNPAIKINGKHLLLNGINYHPTNILASQMHSNEYDVIFDKITEKKLNAVHVIGKGIYESEYFYDLADSRGILVLQDFMFTDKIYPRSSAFLENVSAEAKENINQLKQHPALILWTSGIEPSSSDGNKELQDILEESVKSFDPFHPYVDFLPTDNWIYN